MCDTLSQGRPQKRINFNPAENVKRVLYPDPEAEGHGTVDVVLPSSMVPSQEPSNSTPSTFKV